ncbi:GNAT family N-acetyltransferase [Serratia fonticola]|uniref:GNAT family N-acetyltransferase n=1 Tax=Serratia fonticola TaxID=47917 RepID=UPI0021AD746F|nr:GNAT family N-acetyltransferase [Serratia fonticola]
MKNVALKHIVSKRKMMRGLNPIIDYIKRLIIYNRSKPPKCVTPKTVKNIDFITNKSDKIILIKAMLDGNKIGYLAFTQYDGESLKLADILIYEGYQNLGVGTQLMYKAIAIAASLGVNRIFGVMVGDIDRLKEFYESFGFLIIGTNIELNLT